MKHVIIAASFVTLFIVGIYFAAKQELKNKKPHTYYKIVRWGNSSQYDIWEIPVNGEPRKIN